MDDGKGGEAGQNAAVSLMRMTEELLESMSADLVAKGTGLSLQTIRSIARGGSRRVSKQTQESIRNLHEKFRAEGMELATKLKLMQPKREQPPLQKAAPLPEAVENPLLDAFSTEVLAVMKQDLAAAEKRLALLKEMMELAKEL
ncbi:MAG: hypothetical protein IPP94_05175 [Ignavibacteria bacterium]|nr:hypothetical protein [Ignavibacteria bacterium]